MPDMKSTPGQDALIDWADALESYARDWDSTFANRAAYFTQEYWYLFVACMVENWRGRPLTVSEACQRMKTGSYRTREDRIKKAVDDGYLVKKKTSEDGRMTVVLPTPQLETIMREHFERTYADMRARLNPDNEAARQ